MQKVYPAHRKTSEWAQSVALGGTGADTVEEAGKNLSLVQSLQNLKPNGIILSSSGNILPKNALPGEVGAPSIAALVGSFNVGVGQTTVLTISNYDAFTIYNLSCTSGLVVRRVDEIYYTAGLMAGEATVTINGKDFEFTIDKPIPNTPSVIAPEADAELSSNVVTFESSGFSVNGNLDIHLYSDWEVSTDPEFKTIVASAYESLTNLTTWTVTTMKEYTKYYARVRHHGAQRGVSAWSATDSFTTGSDGELSEVGKIYPTVSVYDSYFGAAIALNEDATLAVIGATWGDNQGADSGTVYVYTRSGDIWTQQQILTVSGLASGNLFGTGIAGNSDLSIVLIGAPRDSVKANSGGAVYVFTRSGSVWSQQQKLYPSDESIADQFGWSVSCNSDATVAIISSNCDSDGATYAGSVYVFTRVGAIWTQGQKFHAGDPGPSDYFGWNVAISGDGLIIMIGSVYDDDTVSGSGSVYIFTQINGVWTQQQKLHAPTPSTNGYFGAGVVLNYIGDVAYIGAIGDSTKAAAAGAVYIFTRSGNIWTQQTKFYASDAKANSGFGTGLALSRDGHYALVGSSLDDAKVANGGSVYAFR